MDRQATGSNGRWTAAELRKILHSGLGTTARNLAATLGVSRSAMCRALAAPDGYVLNAKNHYSAAMAYRANEIIPVDESGFRVEWDYEKYTALQRRAEEKTIKKVDWLMKNNPA